MNSLEELGKKAYQKHIWNDFIAALKIYNIAITKYPKERRLLNNRCMCYVETKDFKKALEDAELMIRLFPNHTKSYYRKGEVLAAMQRYIEAEEAFQKVLSFDPECEDARQQLLDVQVMQLCERGYRKEHALKALYLTLNDTHTTNVEDAENILKYTIQEIFDQDTDMDTDCIYYSDDEDAFGNNKSDPLTDPSNPLKSCSLWIGFITKSVTEDMLKDLFSKYGKLLSVCVYYSSTCAFINYADHIAPGKAMKELQGKLVGGRNILIKFPDSAASQKDKHTKAI